MKKKKKNKFLLEKKYQEKVSVSISLLLFCINLSIYDPQLWANIGNVNILSNGIWSRKLIANCSYLKIIYHYVYQQNCFLHFRQINSIIKKNGA